MGVNVSINKLTEKELEKTWPNKFKYSTQDQDWFNFTRHSGDREFAVQYLLRYSDELDQDSGLLRPNNIDQGIEWVNSHIEFEGNKKRLIEALEKMREDKDLYFTISW